MARHAGQRWHLSCRCDDVCGWSTHVVVPKDADTRAELLVALRAHADRALHGRSIEGVATATNGDVVHTIVLRHP